MPSDLKRIGFAPRGTYWNRSPKSSLGQIQRLSSKTAPRSCLRGSVGIGIMLDARSEPKAQRDFAWNQSSLQSMLDLVASNNLCEITVYTNPEGNQVCSALSIAF